ncbi:Dph6-related ATP pyrophosphatase [Virgibacillus kimchii]
MKDIIVSWSGGKDSALALHTLLQDKNYLVKGLFSTTSAASGRIPVHEVKKELIREQAREVGLPLYEVEIPEGAGNEVYEAMMGRKFTNFKEQGIDTIVYADLLLEDIKAYRDQLLLRNGMKGLYPLWKKDTKEAADHFVAEGFRAVITTVDTEKLPAVMAGKQFDEQFIGSLPEEVDPSGENGEFHTFVFDGPIFKNSISVQCGKRFETFSGRFSHVQLIR